MTFTRSVDPETPAGAEAAVLAPKPIERLREMGQALGMEVPRGIIELFLKDAPKRLMDLSRALTEDDAEAMEHAAHSLRGSSANLGASDLSELCRELEELARGAIAPEARERLGGVEEEFVRVERAMRELLRAEFA